VRSTALAPMGRICTGPLFPPRRVDPLSRTATMSRLRQITSFSILALGSIASVADAQYTTASRHWNRVVAVRVDLDPAGDRKRQTEIAEVLVDATDEMIDALSDTGREVGAPFRDRIRKHVDTVRSAATRTRDYAKSWQQKLERRENAWDACVAVREDLEDLGDAWGALQSEIIQVRKELESGFNDAARVRQERYRYYLELTKAESDAQKKQAEALAKLRQSMREVEEAENQFSAQEAAFDQAVEKLSEALASGTTGAENETKLLQLVRSFHGRRDEARAKLRYKEQASEERTKEYLSLSAEWDKTQLALRDFLSKQDEINRILENSNNFLNWSRQFAAEFPKS
jgi:chromosome segregation ATPase